MNNLENNTEEFEFELPWAYRKTCIPNFFFIAAGIGLLLSIIMPKITKK